MPPSESLRFSHDSGSLIPPWAFWRINLPRFFSLPQKPTGFKGFKDPPHGETRFPEKDGEPPFRRSGNSSRSL